MLHERDVVSMNPVVYSNLTVNFAILTSRKSHSHSRVFCSTEPLFKDDSNLKKTPLIDYHSATRCEKEAATERVYESYIRWVICDDEENKPADELMSAFVISSAHT